MHGWTESVKCCSRLKRKLLSLHSSRNRFRNSSNEKKKKSFSRHFLERKIRDALVAHRKASHGTSASRSSVTNLGRFIESAYSSSCFAFEISTAQSWSDSLKRKINKLTTNGSLHKQRDYFDISTFFFLFANIQKGLNSISDSRWGKAEKGENFR